MLYTNLKKLAREVRAANGTIEVRLPKPVFDHLLRAALVNAQFDERWYLATYPDVAAAVRKGQIASAAEHYVSTGYFEGRLPYEVKVDEEYYFKANGDVREAARMKRVNSAKEHWYNHGSKEGRDPSEKFSLFPV